jgi:hypothetical protein
MKLLSGRNSGTVLCAIALLAIALGTASFARYGARGQQLSEDGADKNPSGQNGKPDAPKINPKEEADYKAVMLLSEGDKKIEDSQQFLQNYPGSRYEEMVENGLVSAYCGKQDWAHFYAAADKILAKDPDDADVLTLVGWIIPHLYIRGEPDALKKLEEAEIYEKHAIEVISVLQKPGNLSDEQFAQAKAARLSQAHSGLGLVYFQKQDFTNSVKELQLVTQGSAYPDPTDLFALGTGLQQLNRNSEAADALAKCGQIPGTLQERCNQMADQAKKAN